MFVSGTGFFFFKQKTAYEMRISDWSSDVCSSDLSAAIFSFPFSGWRMNLRHSAILLLGLSLAACGQSERSEEHTSELQSLMRISYAVFCLKKKTKQTRNNITLTPFRMNNDNRCIKYEMV